MSLQHHWSNAMHRLRIQRSRLDWHLTSCGTHTDTLKVYQSCSYYSYKPLVHSRKETHHWRELSNRWCLWRHRHGYNLGSCGFIPLAGLWLTFVESPAYEPGCKYHQISRSPRAPDREAAVAGLCGRLHLGEEKKPNEGMNQSMDQWINQSSNQSSTIPPQLDSTNKFFASSYMYDMDICVQVGASGTVVHLKPSKIHQFLLFSTENSKLPSFRMACRHTFRLFAIG